MDVMDEFGFWGRQIVEHAYFVALGLEDETLRSEALRFHQTLGSAYQARDLSTFMNLLDAFIRWKESLLARLKGGQWLGWDFPSMLRHMIEEEQYFIAKARGVELTPQQEIAFWLKERLEEVELSTHLLDPSEAATITKLSQAATTLASLGRASLQPGTFDPQALRSAGGSRPQSHGRSLLVMAKSLGERLNGEVRAMQPGRPFSIIPPELRDHVLREGERFVHVLSRLGAR